MLIEGTILQCDKSSYEYWWNLIESYRNISSSFRAEYLPDSDSVSILDNRGYGRRGEVYQASPYPVCQSSNRDNGNGNGYDCQMSEFHGKKLLEFSVGSPCILLNG